MKPIIQAKKIVKTYHTGGIYTPVLRSLDLTVEEGEFLSITGRSGSGKSTLLYQLGLLDHPNSGEILIDGVDVSKLSGDERTNFRLHELGYVFQDYALLPELTAKENVILPLLMQGLPREEAEKDAVTALEKVGLADKLNNLPSELSGGQQQRVSIARAIGHNPKIIFADEPTANLDTETSRAVLDTFIELHRAGQTIVMVTHEDEYAALTDRIVTLSDGVVTAEKNITGQHKNHNN
ncbi:MAG: ABC transporter ATP-binding protein [Candidatus Paceibacterota bacterium]|jgi:putative ABC transport system ATP-binding protein